MAPELWGVLGAALHVAAFLVVVLAYYSVVWIFYAAYTALDRQAKAGPQLVPPEALSPELRAQFPDGYTVPGGLPPLAAKVARAWMVWGVLLDAVGNLGLIAAFLELPQEWLMTQRITRHVERGTGWRARLALWMRQTWLDGLDRHGIHRA